jgi:hypothetical protein
MLHYRNYHLVRCPICDAEQDGCAAEFVYPNLTGTASTKEHHCVECYEHVFTVTRKDTDTLVIEKGTSVA